MQSEPLVDFRGPYSVKSETLDFDIPQELECRRGLYLWAVEFERGYLVNYVGKTIRPFAARLREHKKWSEAGRDICDPKRMALGENWLVANPSRQIILKLFSV